MQRPQLQSPLLARIAPPALVVLWPFLYLFRHVLPINGEYTAIGNDFIILYYKYKLYLLDCLANYQFPLWSPSEAAGFPFYTSPFAQTCYPFNLLLVLFYKMFGGYSPLDHQIFTVFGISIFALGLFMWLKTINKDTRAVLFSTLIMSVSFRVTEILRFPNAVHTAAWYPWVFYAMTKIILSPSLKRAVQYGCLLTFSLICICTGGYPYFSYYSIFLFVPYLLTFLIKPLRIRFIGPEVINWRRASLTLILAGVAAVVICSPYILAVKGLMPLVTDRSGKDFAFSTEYIFNLEDTVGSLVYPPAASTEGWYFFSITALLIIAVYLFGGRDKMVGENARAQGMTSMDTGGDLWVKLFFVIWLALISYISYGKDSYLFVLLWKYMPGFSSLRVWGRLSITLVPILAWLLSLAYTSFTRAIFDRETAGGGLRRVAAKLVVVAAVYAVVLGVQLYMHFGGVLDPMWTRYFKYVTANEAWFIIYGVVAFAAVLVIMVISARCRLAHWWPTAATVLLILVATVELHHTGAKQWAYRSRTPPDRFQLDVAKLTRMSFGFVRTDVTNTVPLSPHFNVSVMPNWYFARYVSFLKMTADEPQARSVLLGCKDGTKIFFSESIEHSSIESFLQDALRYRQTGRPVSYNGDELQWEIDAPEDGFLSFIDNWAPGWKAWVDEQPTEIKLLFGTFKSVHLTPGRHKVKFSYQPGFLPAVKK